MDKKISGEKTQLKENEGKAMKNFFTRFVWIASGTIIAIVVALMFVFGIFITQTKHRVLMQNIDNYIVYAEKIIPNLEAQKMAKESYNLFEEKYNSAFNRQEADEWVKITQNEINAMRSANRQLVQIRNTNLKLMKWVKLFYYAGFKSDFYCLSKYSFESQRISGEIYENLIRIAIHTVNLKDLSGNQPADISILCQLSKTVNVIEKSNRDMKELEKSFTFLK